MVTLAYVGGLGLMAGPAGTHLKPDGPASVPRVHDRGTPGMQKDAFRAGWRTHGAELVSTFDALIGDGKLDGELAFLHHGRLWNQVIPILFDVLQNALEIRSEINSLGIAQDFERTHLAAMGAGS